jgi:hypothetical protein
MICDTPPSRISPVHHAGEGNVTWQPGMPVVTEQDGPPVEQASKYELVINLTRFPVNQEAGFPSVQTGE